MPAFGRVVVLILVRDYPPQCMREEKQEEYNAQVVCCCWLCLLLQPRAGLTLAAAGIIAIVALKLHHCLLDNRNAEEASMI